MLSGYIFLLLRKIYAHIFQKRFYRIVTVQILIMNGNDYALR